MEFNNKEKLLVTLLTDIYAHLKVVGALDPFLVQRAVSSDQGWALEWKYPELFPPSGAGSEDLAYVMRVLSMWERIELSYEALDLEEQVALAREVGLTAAKPVFPGFGKEREGRLQVIARLLVNDLQRWPMFSGRLRSTRQSTAQGYDHMLAALQGLPCGEFDSGQLSWPDLSTLLKAWRQAGVE
ncbi:YfbU family protein, partial [Pseudomonas massiliensis]|uniref:YfbU family protein n=1 Tax=Pseudomonas massiliensis TaxID=522492 RepID=UPI00058CCE68